MDNSYHNTSIGTVSQHASEQFNYPIKFCKFCGGKVHIDAVLCTCCGRQIEALRQSVPVQQMPMHATNADATAGAARPCDNQQL